MYACLRRGVAVLLTVLTLSTLHNELFAQWSPFNQCACGPATAYATPYATASLASAPAAFAANPCAPIAMAAINPCPVMQAIPETVYRDVQVTAYQAVKKTVKTPVVRTVYEDQEVTGYRQIMEPRTVEVPSVTYQQVQECQPMTVNKSYWQTVYQPVAKTTPCQYDGRANFAGWFNRTAYSMRMAMTPNYIPQRQFVPNVIAYNQPVTRTVAVPTTREVTYNVAKMVPYTTTQRVAKQIVVDEDREVTAYEPYTTTKTVAVGTRTRYAMIDPLGGGGTATALAPTPDRTAAQDQPIQQRADNNGRSSAIKQQSFEQAPTQFQPTLKPTPQPSTPTLQTPPAATPSEQGGSPFLLQESHYESRPVPSAAKVAAGGWKPSKKTATSTSTSTPAVVAAN